MTQLYVSQGDYAVTINDILDTLNGGVAAGGNLIVSANIKWKSGTTFFGELDHANTGDRVYTFPNAAGTVALLSNPQTWSGLQTYNTGTIKVNDLLFVTGTRSISQTAGAFQLKSELGTVFNLVINNAIQYTFSTGIFDMLGAVLGGVSLIQGFEDTDNKIDDTASGWSISVNAADSVKILRGSVEYINAGTSGNLVLQAESLIRLLVTGAGDQVAFNDGSGDRITYDWSTDDFSAVDNVASNGKSGRRWVDVWAVNGTIQTSFSKFKKNIQSVAYSNCLEVCKKLEPITFSWKDEQFKDMAEEKLGDHINKKHFGFNADALINDCPEAVAGEDGIYTGAVIGLLLGAVKNLAGRVDTLEST